MLPRPEGGPAVSVLNVPAPAIACPCAFRPGPCARSAGRPPAPPSFPQKEVLPGPGKFDIYGPTSRTWSAGAGAGQMRHQMYYELGVVRKFQIPQEVRAHL